MFNAYSIAQYYIIATRPDAIMGSKLQYQKTPRVTLTIKAQANFHRFQKTAL